MTTNKPSTRPPMKREREDDDSHESPSVDLSDPRPNRAKGASRAHHRDTAPTKVTYSHYGVF